MAEENKMEKATAKSVFKSAVAAAVAKNGHSRWGEAESTSVIEALFDFASSDEAASKEGFDSIRLFVSEVINPSAFAQKLEKLPPGNPCYITRAKRGAKVAGLLD